MSMSDLSGGECEADGIGPSKQALKKKKKKKKGGEQIETEEEELSNETALEKLRRKTVSLMKKTAVYATTTSTS